MKVFVLAPRENWVCDRFYEEWKSQNKEITTNNPEEADVLWLLGSWCWNHLPVSLLEKKKVVTTIHHIVPEKFSKQKQIDFLLRDKITDAYHVPSTKSHDQIRNLTEKKIFNFPFWVNQDLWYQIEEKNSLRKKYNIGENEFVVGSFQRDTEGHDLKSPKLEKGPDIFCNIVEQISNDRENLTVLLAGWRRQYVTNRLKNSNIKYRYFELPDFHTLNELYNCLDLYLVSSRYEGGPQSIVECAANKTPIASTDVGIASEILNPKSILKSDVDITTDVTYAFDKVKNIFMPRGFDPFIKMFNEVFCDD